MEASRDPTCSWGPSEGDPQPCTERPGAQRSGATLRGDGESAVSSRSPSLGSPARSTQPTRVTQPGLQTVINFRGCACIPATQPGSWLLSTDQAHACTPPHTYVHTPTHTHIYPHMDTHPHLVYTFYNHTYTHSCMWRFWPKRGKHTAVSWFSPHPCTCGPQVLPGLWTFPIRQSPVLTRSVRPWASWPALPSPCQHKSLWAAPSNLPPYPFPLSQQVRDPQYHLTPALPPPWPRQNMDKQSSTRRKEAYTQASESSTATNLAPACSLPVCMDWGGSLSLSWCWMNSSAAQDPWDLESVSDWVQEQESRRAGSGTPDLSTASLCSLPQVSLHQAWVSLLQGTPCIQIWRHGMPPMGFPRGSAVKKICLQCRRPGLILGWGRAPGEGHGNPPQYSCLENSMDRVAWWATVHRVEKSRTRLSKGVHTHVPPITMII